MPDPYYIQASTYVQKMSMYNLRCAAEENCLARYRLGSPRPGCPISLQALLLCLVLIALVPRRRELGSGARAAKWSVVSWACGPGWRVNILKISVGSFFQTVTQIREMGQTLILENWDLTLFFQHPQTLEPMVSHNFLLKNCTIRWKKVL